MYIYNIHIYTYIYIYIYICVNIIYIYIYMWCMGCLTMMLYEKDALGSVQPQNMCVHVHT